MIATLAAIHIHPVKSCAPLALQAASVEARGLAHDRRYLVVDADGRFLTGRQLPRLTLLRALPVAGGLALQAPGMPAHALAAPDGNPERITVTVWRTFPLVRLRHTRTLIRPRRSSNTGLAGMG